MSQANTNRSSNGRPGGPAATRAEATPPSLEAALQIVFEDKDRGFALPIGVKKLTSRIKERFPGLEAVGVKVACKEVKLALEGNSSRIRLLAERALKIQRQAAEAQRFEAALAAENEAWAREAARRIELARAEEAARQRRAEYEARQARAAEEARQRRADRVNHYEVGSAPGVASADAAHRAALATSTPPPPPGAWAAGTQAGSYIGGQMPPPAPSLACQHRVARPVADRPDAASFFAAVRA